MKTNGLLLLLLSLVTVAPAAGPAAPCRADCSALARGDAPLVLDVAVQADLLFQIEEERMAHELYTAFAARWDLRPFHRIAPAEARHGEALRALAARAGLAVPASGPGRFASPVIQERFDGLLARGSVSATAAREAGATVERQDIADLDRLLAGAAPAELKAVAAQLRQGSERHLRAFERGSDSAAGDLRGHSRGSRRRS